ncbi:MAG: 2-amino-4-hydroxy-6-hydroxymethyldihydropteridine diphosphokinase [Candidatus Hydrogenedens sp.]|nr:2-amino-4-hydroxy-6-hydroxymethyldihydropteridine diphosphokinase [Candidatus Hydrogenedens sp.]
MAAGEAVYVALGGNIEPERHLALALEALAAQFRIDALSGVYSTPAIGRPEQAPYLNAVARFDCMLPPRELKYGVLRAIEDDLGRLRCPDKFAARNIDIDLLLYGDRVIDEPGVEVPDADIPERPFLVRCLLDIDPDLELPGRGPLRNFVSAESEALTPLETFVAEFRRWVT